VSDADAALAGDAEGIGLFRSEFLYLGRNDYPDEDTQYESYRKVIEKMEKRQVIIRTLDIEATGGLL
jgi:phosphotransferase system enzyme I (PtsI)